jgi:hypothetical protein
VDKRLARVLLIGKSERDFFLLRQHLVELGCQCTFVSSYSEGVKLFDHQMFDLVLCSGQPGIRALFPSVVGSVASLFCAHPIEDSCLWVPVVVNGEECLGVPTLRPSEFTETIRRIVDEIKVSSDRTIAATH